MYNTISPTIENAINDAYKKRENLNKASIIQANSTAEIIAQNIHKEILSFQKNLKETDDVAMSIVSFNSNTLLFVDSIGYIGYNLIKFSGMDSLGKPLKLIQHVSQLNFLLTVVPKPEPEAPKRQIGFSC